MIESGRKCLQTTPHPVEEPNSLKQAAGIVEAYVSTMEDFAELEAFFGYNPHTADYLVNISERNRYLYVENAKVACTTIKRSLQLAEFEGDLELLPENVHDRSQSPLIAPSGNMPLFRSIFTEDFFRFTFVRNPYTRALSCYLEKFVENQYERERLSPELGLTASVIPSFEEFLIAVREQSPGARDIHWEGQAFLLRPHAMKYTFVGRFEQFGSHWKKVFEYLGLPAGGQAQMRHSTDASSRLSAHYGWRERALVREIYVEDFLTFGYGFGLDLI